MKRLLLLLMFSLAAFGQTAVFPTAIASDETIGVSIVLLIAISMVTPAPDEEQLRRFEIAGETGEV